MFCRFIDIDDVNKDDDQTAQFMDFYRNKDSETIHKNVMIKERKHLVVFVIFLSTICLSIRKMFSTKFREKVEIFFLLSNKEES